MNDSIIVEILLAILAGAVGFVSYLGSARAQKAQANAGQADVESQAYNRAKEIYESAIEALEGHVDRLREQTEILDREVSKLRMSNAELQHQVIELQIANVRLESELRTLKGNGIHG